MPQLNLARRDLADRTVISLAGEIDLESVPLLRELFAQCMHEGVRTVDVDLIAVTFCDCSGLRAFLEMSRRLAKAGGALRLYDPPTVLARILDLTGTAPLLLGLPGLPSHHASLQPTAGPLLPCPPATYDIATQPVPALPAVPRVRGDTRARRGPRQRPCSYHLPASGAADNRRSLCTSCSSRLWRPSSCSAWSSGCPGWRTAFSHPQARIKPGGGWTGRPMPGRQHLAPRVRPGVRREPRGLRGCRDCMTALRRTAVSLWNQDAEEWAAALTYYAILALVPGVLVTVSLIGIAGPAATQDLISQVTAMVPADIQAVAERTLRDMADQRAAAWLLAITGTAGALWSASSYLAVFRRSLHTMHGVRDHRPFWRTVSQTVLTAAALLTLLVASTILLMLTGGAAHALGSALGMDYAALTAWNTLKWPLLLCMAVVLVLLLFHSGPPPTRRMRRIVPGGVLALVLWLAASAGFGLYVTWAGTYNRLYGSLAGSIVFLVWLWVSNLTLLAGAQFNAELAKLHPQRARVQAADPAAAAPGPAR